jgi:hypothetical protein
VEKKKKKEKRKRRQKGRKVKRDTISKSGKKNKFKKKFS